MSGRDAPEPVESVTTRHGYGETEPASEEDVEKAREQTETLSSSPATPVDRSLTGESEPKDLDDIHGPATDEP